MNAEIETLVTDIKDIISLLYKHLNIDATKTRLEELTLQIQDESLWDDPKRAQTLLKERDTLSQKWQTIEKLEKDLADYVELLEFDDPEFEREAQEGVVALHTYARRLRLETLLSGEADSADCFVDINAGAGGTEAQDWAQMLGRMYARWAESKGYKVEIVDENQGEEAGLKSIIMQIKGHQVYGWLKHESGVHRLVRISPFDSNARRHTSFASVWVYPVIDDAIHIEIDDKDLRIDTYRASGAGGQHVNKTESAIRITHLPTGVVVQCQNDRSQHRNKAQAFSMLRSRLYELELRKREEEAKKEDKGAIGWGHQIRSYVLQPYQLVKDNRTNIEKGNAHGVLEGDIDAFLEGALTAKL